MSALTRLAAPILCGLPAVLICLTVTASAEATLPAGSVVSWGYDSDGQLAPPDAVNGVSGTAIAIAASPAGHSCAIQAGTGNVVCWGSNRLGEATPPDAVNGVSGTATDISAGWYHSCAIQSGTGKVICWGGSGGAPGHLFPPDAVNGVAGTASKIATGSFHSCAIQAGTGVVICWGSSNYFGQLTPPNAVNGVAGTATAVAAGDEHSCAVQAGTGKVVCWGASAWGRTRPPDAVNGVLGGATDISADRHFSCAIQAGTGAVVCWGSAPLEPIPDAVNGVAGSATSIAAGLLFACAIQAGTGDVVCWGWDDYGQASPPDAVNGVAGSALQVATGNHYALAIAAPPEPIRLTRPQQACVRAMNASGEKVNRAQLWQNERCLSNFQRERLVAPLSFDACTTADASGRVRRAEAWTEIWERVKCDSLDELPPFAYTDSATVNAAAADDALALTHAIFGGPPVLDADLVTIADDRRSASCQLRMLERVDQLESSILEQLNKAKRLALRDETVDSRAAFEEKLQAALASNDPIDRVRDRLVAQVDDACADLQTPLNALFPGECGGGNPSLGEVEACAIMAARCTACLQMNAFDDLNLDCDRADDQRANASCLNSGFRWRRPLPIPPPPPPPPLPPRL